MGSVQSSRSMLYDDDYYAWIQEQVRVMREHRLEALRKTRLPDDAIPEECPWTVEQLIDTDFFSGGDRGRTPKRSLPR